MVKPPRLQCLLQDCATMHEEIYTLGLDEAVTIFGTIRVVETTDHFIWPSRISFASRRVTGPPSLYLRDSTLGYSSRAQALFRFRDLFTLSSHWRNTNRLLCATPAARDRHKDTQRRTRKPHIAWLVGRGGDRQRSDCHPRLHLTAMAVGLPERRPLISVHLTCVAIDD